MPSAPACCPCPQGKELIENLTVLRFANLVFEPLWSRQYIRNVQVWVVWVGGWRGVRGAVAACVQRAACRAGARGSCIAGIHIRMSSEN